MIEKYANLICPGAMKAGTTSLFGILKQHPDIFTPKIKELHFFDKNFDKGMEYYSEYFKASRNEKYRIDVTPYYMVDKSCVMRIKETLGTEVKFVIMLRNPVDRAYSMYFMRKNQIRETLGFEDALEQEEIRIAESDYNFRQFSYKTRGFYSEQVKPILEEYPRENVHFILFEEFIADTESEIRKLFNFLGIDEEAEISYSVWEGKPWQYKHKKLIGCFNRIKNTRLANLYKRILGNRFKGINRRIAQKMRARKDNPLYMDKKPETSRQLMELYVSDIHELERLTGRSLLFWIKKYIPDYKGEKNE